MCARVYDTAAAAAAIQDRLGDVFYADWSLPVLLLLVELSCSGEPTCARSKKRAVKLPIHVCSKNKPRGRETSRLATHVLKIKTGGGVLGWGGPELHAPLLKQETSFAHPQR